MERVYEEGARGSSVGGYTFGEEAQPPRFYGRINEVDGLVSTYFWFLCRLPALEISAKYEKLPSDLYDPDSLILNDSAEMPNREPCEFCRIRNVQERSLYRYSIGRLHGSSFSGGLPCTTGTTIGPCSISMEYGPFR